MKPRRRFFVWTMTVAMVILADIHPRCFGQQPSLPSNWQNLGASEFAQAVAPFYDIDAETLFIRTIDDDAVRSQAAKIVGSIDFANTALDYSTLNVLQMLASPKLADSEKARIKGGLGGRQDDWTGHPFPDFFAKWNLLYRLKFSPQVRLQEGMRWAKAGNQISAVPPENLADAYFYFAPAVPALIESSFSVSWRGQVTAPATGAYTFSISPINTNAPADTNPVQVGMSVAVGGDRILSANSNVWAVSSTPINLTAGQPATIAVDWSCQVGQRLPTRALHALLYWQGPGVARALVPKGALTVPDASGAGLAATYRWIDSSGQPQTLMRTESNIDIAWNSIPVALLVDTQLTEQASTTVLNATTAPDYVSRLTQLKPPLRLRQLHPVFQDPDATGQVLNSGQRGTILQLLQGQPTLLDPVDPKPFAMFFATYRIGNPDSALDVLGSWANRHADILPAIPTGAGFDTDARAAYRRLAIYTTIQMPDQAMQLQNRYLVTADGRCCLPIAYTLTYSYLAQKKLADWAQFLNSRIQDSSVVGDLKVNWLLARALVQEVHQARRPLSLNGDVYTRPMDGKYLVDQASQSAQSAAVKTRLALEAAGRLAATGQFDAAATSLQAAAASATPDQASVVAAWINQIAALQSAPANSPVFQTKAARDAYLGTLRQRRDREASQGHTELVNRYNALINSLTAQ